MAPSVATFSKVSAASGNNMKEGFWHQAKAAVREGRNAPF